MNPKRYANEASRERLRAVLVSIGISRDDACQIEARLTGVKCELLADAIVDAAWQQCRQGERVKGDDDGE